MIITAIRFHKKTLVSIKLAFWLKMIKLWRKMIIPEVHFAPIFVPRKSL